VVETTQEELLEKCSASAPVSQHEHSINEVNLKLDPTAICIGKAAESSNGAEENWSYLNSVKELIAGGQSAK
jgi:hypothetical protein